MFWISVKSIWSSVSFNATVSLLIFCLDGLSIDVSWVLKSPIIIVLLSISTFIFFIDFYILGCFYTWVHKYLHFLYLRIGLFPLLLYSIFLSLVTIFVLKSILSYINIDTLDFLRVLLESLCSMTVNTWAVSLMIFLEL